MSFPTSRIISQLVDSFPKSSHNLFLVRVAPGWLSDRCLLHAACTYSPHCGGPMLFAQVASMPCILHPPRTMHTGSSMQNHNIGEGWQCILPHRGLQSRGYFRVSPPHPKAGQSRALTIQADMTKSRNKFNRTTKWTQGLGEHVHIQAQIGTCPGVERRTQQPTRTGMGRMIENMS